MKTILEFLNKGKIKKIDNGKLLINAYDYILKWYMDLDSRITKIPFSIKLAFDASAYRATSRKIPYSTLISFNNFKQLDSLDEDNTWCDEDISYNYKMSFKDNELYLNYNKYIKIFYNNNTEIKITISPNENFYIIFRLPIYEEVPNEFAIKFKNVVDFINMDDNRVFHDLSSYNYKDTLNKLIPLLKEYNNIK